MRLTPRPAPRAPPRPRSQGVSGDQMLRLTDTDLLALGLTDAKSRSNLLIARDTLLAPLSAAAQQGGGGAGAGADADGAARNGAPSAAAMTAAYEDALKARPGSAGGGDGSGSGAAASAGAAPPGAAPAAPAGGAAGAAPDSVHGGNSSGLGSGSLPGAVAARARRNSVDPADKVVVYVLHASPTGRLFRCGGRAGGRGASARRRARRQQRAWPPPCSRPLLPPVPLPPLLPPPPPPRRAQLEIPRALQPLAAHLSLLYDLKRAAHYHLLNCRALLVRFVAVFELLTEVPALRPAWTDAAAARRMLLAAGLREEDMSGDNALGSESALASPRGGRLARSGSSIGVVLATQLEDLASDAHDLFAQFSEP
jgi:hypothetical protein